MLNIDGAISSKVFRDKKLDLRSEVDIGNALFLRYSVSILLYFIGNTSFVGISDVDRLISSIDLDASRGSC